MRRPGLTTFKNMQSRQKERSIGLFSPQVACLKCNVLVWPQPRHIIAKAVCLKYAAKKENLLPGKAFFPRLPLYSFGRD